VHASKVFIKAKILKTVYSNSSKVCYSNSPVNSSNAATGKMFKHSQTNQERGHSIWWRSAMGIHVFSEPNKAVSHRMDVVYPQEDYLVT